MGHSHFTNANFPISHDGRTYHVTTKKGEVSNRILTVGDSARLHRLKALLDEVSLEITSKRGFTTVTGKYKGVDVSIVSIGMGVAMMDFFVREVRNVVTGPMFCIRLGSCGSVSGAKIGQVSVADSAVLISRNPDAFHQEVSGEEAYRISRPCPADSALTELLKTTLESHLTPENVVVGLNATADTFYASQGRSDDAFDDKNTSLINDLQKKYPHVKTLEMETFMLYHLAKCSKEPIHASACAMVFAERLLSNAFISPDQVDRLEELAGRAVLETLAKIPI